MIKEIALLGALLSPTMPLNASSSNSIITKEFMNSTDYNLAINGEASLRAHSLTSLNYDNSTDLYLMVEAEEEPTDIYYWISQVDNEQEVLIDWEDGENDLWTFLIPSLDNPTINGIQFFQRVSLVGETFYLIQPDLSNVSVSSGNILEDGNTAKIGNYSLTSLTWHKERMDNGLLGYGYYQGNGTTFASNSKVSNPTDFNQLTNIVLYRGDWSNVLTFTSGYYGRVWNTQGHNDTPSAFLSKEYVAYATLTSANDIDSTLVPLTTGFSIVGKVIEAMNSVFTWQVLPGLTIGVLFLIPTIVLIVLALLKLIKKG